MPEARPRTEHLAWHVRQAIEEPFRVLGRQMRLGMSKGFAGQNDGPMTSKDLLRQAGLAMDEAKRHDG